jgi:hypothetical protein
LTILQKMHAAEAMISCGGVGNRRELGKNWTEVRDVGELGRIAGMARLKFGNGSSGQGILRRHVMRIKGLIRRVLTSTWMTMS